jgi:hypothetical protein
MFLDLGNMTFRIIINLLNSTSFPLDGWVSIKHDEKQKGKVSGDLCVMSDLNLSL